jgi:biopolymer transport protein ExbB/TolQ
MEYFDLVVRFFQNGGPFMYPIGVVLALGVAITLERFLYLTHARVSNRQAYGRLLPLLERGDLKGALKLAEESKTPVVRLLASGIERVRNSRRRDDIEAAMEETILETVPRLEKRTQYLATLANVATLLGLLGTIIGLIAAFTAVASADPAEKASLLSQSISVAMNTTAFGLMTAIPLLLCHAMLQTRTTEIVDSLEMAGVKFINILAESRPAPAAAPQGQA